MRIVTFFTAGFALAAAAFLATMLVSPPTSEAAVTNASAAVSTPLVLVGP